MTRGLQGPQYRRVTAWFAELMRKRLVQNRDKGGWTGCSEEYLMERLRQETEELRNALRGGLPRNAAEVQTIVQEATDVANFALMVADVATRR